MRKLQKLILCIQAYLDWGNALDEQGRHKEAIEICERAALIYKGKAYIHHNIASYRWNQGDYRGARKAWREACNAYKHNKDRAEKNRDADFFYYYGWVLHEKMWNLDESKHVLEQGLAIDNNHTGILARLVNLQLDRHDELCDDERKVFMAPEIYSDAIKRFTKAKNILEERLKSCNKSKSLQELGDLYFQIQDYDKAKDYYQKALVEDPDSMDLNESMGVIYSRKKDFRQAVWYFEKSHNLNLYNLDVWSNLAEAYLKTDPKDLRQIRKAETEFKKIVKIAPDNIDSHIGLGEVYTAMAEAVETDFYKAAIEQYSRAVQLHNTNSGSKHLKKWRVADLHYMLGYSRVSLYEALRPFGKIALLRDAFHDFKQCTNNDYHHCKGMLAKVRLSNHLSMLTKRLSKDTVVRWSFLVIPSAVVFAVTQLAFFNVLKPRYSIDAASYIVLTFGSLIFVVVGLLLPEIQKLKGVGFELEKSSVTQISASESLGISKD
jgi:tetratricopeptide (TPR) repeat protein